MADWVALSQRSSSGLAIERSSPRKDCNSPTQSCARRNASTSAKRRASIHQEPNKDSIWEFAMLPGWDDLELSSSAAALRETFSADVTRTGEKRSYLNAVPSARMSKNVATR